MGTISLNAGQLWIGVCSVCAVCVLKSELRYVKNNMTSHRHAHWDWYNLHRLQRKRGPGLRGQIQTITSVHVAASAGTAANTWMENTKTHTYKHPPQHVQIELHTWTRE